MSKLHIAAIDPPPLLEPLKKGRKIGASFRIAFDYSFEYADARDPLTLLASKQMSNDLAQKWTGIPPPTEHAVRTGSR
jgi:hypothetical protein